MGKCKKIMKVAYTIICASVLFCLQLSAGDPGNLYRDRPRSG